MARHREMSSKKEMGGSGGSLRSSLGFVSLRPVTKLICLIWSPGSFDGVSPLFLASRKTSE